VRDELGDAADDVFVHGSRAVGRARPDSDIDFKMVLSKKDFSDAILANREWAHNGQLRADISPSRMRGLMHAVTRGRIFRREAGLRPLAVKLGQVTRMRVDFSKVAQGGLFDAGPNIPLPDFAIPTWGGIGVLPSLWRVPQ